jgi:tripartite-type tricarboxylate transporter receptor subunit TctC
MGRRSACRCIASVAACALLPAGAVASTAGPGFPDHPVRLLIGYPPGGGTDLMARPLAQRLAERLGQPVLVENRPGANGNLATEAVARAMPDGHTLLLGNAGQLATNPAVYQNLPFNTQRDLAPVAQVVEAAQVVVVTAQLPVRTLGELISLARERPGRLAMGSSGNGGMSHLTLERLKRLAGLDILHVPYRGSVPALQDLLGGRVQIMIDPYAPFRGPVEAGQVRVLAVTSRARLPALPDIPTMAEIPGLEGFEATGFVGLLAPSATPPAVLAALETAVEWAMRETDLPATFEAQGQTPHFAGAAAFHDLITRAHETWKHVARQAGVTVD